jgi:5'-deoxynucleotidase YfbR-like HD superfamily hydrolase
MEGRPGSDDVRVRGRWAHDREILEGELRLLENQAEGWEAVLVPQESIQAPLPADVILRMYDVIRWHTCRPMREQGVLEHSAMVANLVMHLDPSLSTEELGRTLQMALLHDAHEAEFGDIPRPAIAAFKSLAGADLDGVAQAAFWQKRGGDPFDRVSPRGRAVVRLADALEAALFSARWVPQAAAKAREDAKGVIREINAVAGMQDVAVRAVRILGIGSVPAGKRDW